MSELTLARQLLNLFLTEPPRDDKGQTYEDSRRFRRGLTIWKSKTLVVLPAPLAIFIELLLLSSITADAIFRADVDWIDKIAEYSLVCNCLYFCCASYLKRDAIDSLSSSVDQWWNHRLLERETKQLKNKSVEWMNTFNWYFYKLLLWTCIGYILLPFLRFYFIGSDDLSNLYIFRIWTPLPRNEIWPVAILYSLQVITMFIQYFSYGHLATYMMSVAVVSSFQVQLVEISLVTVRTRGLDLSRKNPAIRKDDSQWHKLFCSELLKEISESARHYQHIYRNWKQMCKLLSKMVDIIFYSGMLIVIMFGVRVVNGQESIFLVMNSLLFMIVVIINQYLFTIINGVFTNQVISLQSAVYFCPWYKLPIRCRKNINIFQIMVSHVPTLSTFMGIEASREFFSKTINATYCYINALISMNRK